MDIADTLKNFKKDFVVLVVAGVHMPLAVTSTWTATLWHAVIVVTDASRKAHVRNNWLFGACDAPLTRNDNQDLVCLVLTR